MPFSPRSTNNSTSQHTVAPGPSQDKHPTHSNPLNGKKANSDPPSIMTRNGPCQWSIPSGKHTINCSCPEGVFNVPLGKTTPGKLLCDDCGHELSVHKTIEHTSDISLCEFPNTILSPLDCPRTDTVSKLWIQLQAVQVLHVRGTPTSGKSTLANLLHAYVMQARPDYKIYKFSWPTSLPPGLSTISPYNHILNTIVGKSSELNDWPSLSNTLIIIDEAQLSYNHHSLWNDFIKPLASDPKWGPQMILFTSYSSPSQHPVETPIGVTPVFFTANQRISIRCLPKNNNPNISLYFSKAEFKDVVNRVSLYYGQHGQLFVLSADLQSYVWNITNGHPGGVRVILEDLAHSNELHSFRKAGQTIPLSVGVQVLDNDVVLMHNLAEGTQGFKQSLPPRQKLQDNPALLQVLRDVLIDGCSRGDPSTDVALNECYRRGWLHAELSTDERTVYLYPTRVHMRYAEILLREKSIPFPISRYPNLRSLSLVAVQRFSRTSLRSGGRGLGTAAEVRPVEAQYQDEFYRACYQVLDNKVYLTSEWTGQPSTGRVDFHVKAMKWAIICLKDGDRLDENISSFLPNGSYYNWIASGSIKEHILLDFRKTVPIKPRHDVPFLFYIVFSAEYSTYRVYDAKISLIVEETALLE